MRQEKRLTCLGALGDLAVNELFQRGRERDSRKDAKSAKATCVDLILPGGKLAEFAAFMIGLPRGVTGTD